MSNKKKTNNNRKNVTKIADSFRTLYYAILVRLQSSLLTPFRLVSMEKKKKKNNDNKLFHVCLLFDPFNNHHISMSTVFHCKTTAHSTYGCTSLCQNICYCHVHVLLIDFARQQCRNAKNKNSTWKNLL